MSEGNPPAGSFPDPGRDRSDAAEQQLAAVKGLTEELGGASAESIRGSLDPYEEELERTKSQLLIFAKEISSMYQRERQKGRQLSRFDDEVKSDYLSIVQTLALVVEAKDQYTRNHLDRCKAFGTALARSMDPRLVTPEVQYGFLLHDVGKIGIPESILLKQGPLDPEEYDIMRRHPLIGVQLIEPMKRILGNPTLEIIRHHHERYDGGGYPDGLAGELIPLAARVFTVVDSFDAMTTDRPYRRALSRDEAMSRLEEGAGTQFDPEVVMAWKELVISFPEAIEVSGGGD
ncbi:MAG: HD-GYP domain-containing protein [Actinomycetota bacterium]